MKFWDSSALAPLLFSEAGTGKFEARLREDQSMVVWYATPVECSSAIFRRVREQGVTLEAAENGLARLDMLSKSWFEVEPTDAVRTRAQRLLRIHPLRAADALQLASALVFSGEDPTALDFLCMDQRLINAARSEGFRVVS